MYQPFSLKDKIIFVTGASSGIGRAVAVECAKMGAQLIITGRNEQRLEETLNELEGTGHSKINADLNSEADIAKIVDFLPHLSGMVHGAGITTHVPIQYINREKINEIFDVNFFAPALICQKVVKEKKIKDQGSIVFVSSIAGIYCSSVGGSLYAATKGAVNGFIKGMALDLSPKKIRVNSITPGVVDTTLLKEGAISTDQLQEEMKRYPLKRFGKPEEIAYAAIYLLSDASAFVTGSNLLIDGGYTLL